MKTTVLYNGGQANYDFADVDAITVTNSAVVVDTTENGIKRKSIIDLNDEYTSGVIAYNDTTFKNESISDVGKRNFNIKIENIDNILKLITESIKVDHSIFDSLRNLYIFRNKCSNNASADLDSVSSVLTDMFKYLDDKHIKYTSDFNTSGYISNIDSTLKFDRIDLNSWIDVAESTRSIITMHGYTDGDIVISHISKFGDMYRLYFYNVNEVVTPQEILNGTLTLLP